MDPAILTLIHSHLDGRLSAAETERLGELIRDDAAVAAAFAEASRLNHMLREAVKEDFRASLHARRVGGAGSRRLHEDEEEKPATPSPARRLVRQLAIAACLALFLGGMLALFTTGSPGPKAVDSSPETNPSSLEARASGARGPFLRPVGPAKADALLRKRLRQFILPDPGVKNQPASAALAAMIEKWSTLPQADETWAKTIRFSIAPEVTEAWKAASSEPKVTLEIPGTSLHANLELLAAQADLKVTTSEQGVRLVAAGMAGTAGKSDAEKMVEIRGSVELAAMERLPLTEQQKQQRYFPEDAAKAEEVKVLFRKGLGYFDLGLFDEAMDAMNRILALDPYNTAARRQLERIAAEMQREPLDASLSKIPPSLRAEFAMKGEPLPADSIPASNDHTRPAMAAPLDALNLSLLLKAYPGDLAEVDDPILDQFYPAYQQTVLELEEKSLEFGRKHPAVLGLDRKKKELAQILAKHCREKIRARLAAIGKNEEEIAAGLLAENGAPPRPPDMSGMAWIRSWLLNAGVAAYCRMTDHSVEWRGEGTRRELRIANAVQSAIQEATAISPVEIRVLEYPEDASTLPFEPATTTVLSAEQVQAEFKRPGLKAVGFMREESEDEIHVLAKQPVEAAGGEPTGLETRFEIVIRTLDMEGHRVRLPIRVSASRIVSEDKESAIEPDFREVESRLDNFLFRGNSVCVPLPDSEEAQSRPRRFLFVSVPE